MFHESLIPTVPGMPFNRLLEAQMSLFFKSGHLFLDFYQKGFLLFTENMLEVNDKYNEEHKKNKTSEVSTIKKANGKKPGAVKKASSSKSPTKKMSAKSVQSTMSSQKDKKAGAQKEIKHSNVPKKEDVRSFQKAEAHPAHLQGQSQKEEQKNVKG